MAKAVYTLQKVLGRIAGSGAEFAQGSTVSYSFSYIPSSPYGSTSALNAGQKAFAREAMSMWDDVANIRFAETSSTSANIRMYNVNNPSFAGGQFSDQIMLSSSYSYMLNPSYGNYGFMAIIHEIGHSLGLDHPGNYNGGYPTYEANALYMQDSQQYTLMSYFGAYNTGANHNGYYASGPLLHDIAAIQYLYGADMTTRTGDTVYGFGSNAGRTAFDFSQNTAPIISIWDAGGNDTLNLSGYNATQLIDLRAGNFSDVGGLTKNVSIAYNVVIENAVGGSGNDTIYGNSANNVLTGGAGNDILNGMEGEDRLVGGLGDDTYYINSAGDVMVELSGQGTDTVVVSTTFTLANNFENLILGGSLAVNGTGNAAANTLTGNRAANILDGAAGADTMIGDRGHDTYMVDNSGDRVIELAGGGTDTVISSVSFVLTDTLENLTFTGLGNVNGTGSLAKNIITGNAGNNTLSGLAGNDTIYGGLGNDRIIGGAGADTLWGGDGRDVFVFDSLSAGTRDRIKDFSVAQHDVLDVSGLLVNFNMSQFDSYFRLTSTSSLSNLFIDRDGAGSTYSFFNYATIDGLTGQTARSLYNSGDFIV